MARVNKLHRCPINVVDNDVEGTAICDLYYQEYIIMVYIFLILLCGTVQTGLKKFIREGNNSTSLGVIVINGDFSAMSNLYKAGAVKFVFYVAKRFSTSDRQPHVHL